MIEIKLSSNSIDELRVQVVALNALLSATSEQPETEQPAKRTRKSTKVDAPAETALTPTEQAKEAGLRGQQIPSADSLFATAEAAPTPEPVKQPEQKDLIAAMRTLNDKKGTDAIVAMLGKYGAKTVALIPKERWAEAIAEAQKLAA